jgi:hypothetical protein
MDIGRSPDRVQLPPGFTALICAERPLDAAVNAARDGADPGTLFHNDLGARCAFAVILSPHRPVADTSMLALGARAVQSALAALAPEQVPVRIAGADRVEVDGAEVATLAVVRAPTMCDAVPDWIVLEITIAIDLHLSEPGMTPGVTCLAEEGFPTSAAEVLGTTCRALLAGIHDHMQGEA